MEPRIRAGTPQEAEAVYQRAAERLHQISDRFQLGLVAGTAGAFVIVAGQIITAIEEPEVVATLLPSCWLFAAALAAAGLAPLIAWVNQLIQYLVMKDVTTKDGFAPTKQQLSIMAAAWWCQAFAVGLSIVLFAAGVLTPLLAVSGGYERTF